MSCLCGDISWRLWRGHASFRLPKLQAEDDAQGRQSRQHRWLCLALQGAIMMQLLHVAFVVSRATGTWSSMPQTLARHRGAPQQWGH